MRDLTTATTQKILDLLKSMPRTAQVLFGPNITYGGVRGSLMSLDFLALVEVADCLSNQLVLVEQIRAAAKGDLAKAIDPAHLDQELMHLFRADGFVDAGSAGTTHLAPLELYLTFLSPVPLVLMVMAVYFEPTASNHGPKKSEVIGAANIKTSRLGHVYVFFVLHPTSKGPHVGGSGRLSMHMYSNYDPIEP
jgi:hypothetical protein